MALDAWLPIGYLLPDGATFQCALFEGAGWQVLQTRGDGRALIVDGSLMRRWIESALVDEGQFTAFEFGEEQFWSISSGPKRVLCPVSDGKSPNSKSEALAFALAFKATRAIDTESPLQDALYVEKISRLLPTYSISSRADDAVVLGYWLTGGATVSVMSFRRLQQMLSWLSASHLKEVVEAAGFQVTEEVSARGRRPSRNATGGVSSETLAVGDEVSQNATSQFELAGRPELEAFFNEHIVDIIQNSDRYKALGIGFPSAVVLHGPPGCGKTFAVERLIDFLGWPSFQIDASAVASPYIHETSKKVAAVFEKAMEDAPSVLVIDEMEAFLADREMGVGSSHHRVEEVAEFLRRIPEATKNNVLIIAMTNRVEMIDPAILRRGRFDHIVKVDYASAPEVLSLLQNLLSTIPNDADVDPTPLAKALAGRPLSDVAFVVREGARLAARSGKDRLDQGSLLSALKSAPARGHEEAVHRRIGFI